MNRHALMMCTLWLPALAMAKAAAGELTAECPVSVPPAAIKPGQAVKGWISTPQQMHLRAAGMMMGGPKTSMYVDPVENTRAKQVFTFDEGDGERWLWCGYGGLQLARRLDDRARRCTLIVKTQRRGGVPTLTAVVECT